MDVRARRDAGESDRSDELSARDRLSRSDVDRARVVVAGLESARVLHADAQSADRDRSRRDNDAVIGRAQARAIRSGDVHAAVAPPEVLREDAVDR